MKRKDIEMKDRVLRETLERAAKAIGLRHEGFERRSDECCGLVINNANGTMRFWNPDNNSDDALGLACALSLDIEINQVSVVVSWGRSLRDELRESCDGTPKGRLLVVRQTILAAAAFGVSR